MRTSRFRHLNDNGRYAGIDRKRLGRRLRMANRPDYRPAGDSAFDLHDWESQQEHDERSVGCGCLSGGVAFHLRDHSQRLAIRRAIPCTGALVHTVGHFVARRRIDLRHAVDVRNRRRIRKRLCDRVIWPNE